MPRKPVPEADLAEIKREVDTVVGQARKLMSDSLTLVGELKLKLEALEQKLKR